MSLGERLKGVFTVMATPLTRAGEIDREAAAALARPYVSKGVPGLVVAVNNGELPYLTGQQWAALVEPACDAAGGRVMGVAGVIDTDTADAAARAKAAAACGTKSPRAWEDIHDLA